MMVKAMKIGYRDGNDKKKLDEFWEENQEFRFKHPEYKTWD